MNPKVDFFFNKTSKWNQEYNKLRSILLNCGLTEELKWGCPCYTFQKNNVVLIHGFKEYCALLFHKGVLLKDTENILIQQTKDVQVARQIRFTSISEIENLQHTIRAYVYEAIEVEKAGIQPQLKEVAQFEMADEFKSILDEQPELKKAFEELTPGRQRAYLLHFSQPKQSKTRTSRVEKAIPKIMDGKGLND
ncbi:MAG: YdeI/OmpD-associated family protein [Cytophagales bacterium]|nr:YdeI/OmpD-associated family protein [Cytophagales bacterium]